jgi:RIO kinase 1
MGKHNNLDFYEPLGDYDDTPNIRNMSNRERRNAKTGRQQKTSKRKHKTAQTNITDQMDGIESFKFSYQASHHERTWIVDSLGGFFEQQWLDDILRLLKGGKEAHVYQCLTNPTITGIQSPYLAAKVYRPRRFRNLKNDHLYREGRVRLDENGHEIVKGGKLHAMNKRTDYGLKLMHTSWIEHEYQTMQILHRAGADVPVPLVRGDNAILMEYIGDDEMPAPTLNSVDLDSAEAQSLFRQVLRNVEIMLANNRIHGDLSAYNILYWEGEITLIDFPQAIDPEKNRNAYWIFERDMVRVSEYFTRQGLVSNPYRIAAQMWTSMGWRLQPDVDPGLLNEEDEGDHAYWQRLQNQS